MGTRQLLGDAHADVRQRARDEAVRRDRYADTGRRGVRGELRQLRVGADAGSQSSSRSTGRRSRVLVDGAPLGHGGLQPRAAGHRGAVPGLPEHGGANGAVGFRVIDTTTLTNGLHTISWTVTDNQGVHRGHRQPVLHGVERGRGR